MYYYVKGNVVYSEEGRLVVENNGIGYDLLVSNNTLSKLAQEKGEVTVYTLVRSTDDAIKIYGFYGIDEKSMFLKLISTNGVGPKLALQILSAIDPKTLALNIVASDYKALAKVKGIGKKTAMKIIIELKEKLEEEDLDSLGESAIRNVDDQVSQDAILALASLGMNRVDATKQVAEARAKADTVEDIITIVLKGMRR